MPEQIELIFDVRVVYHRERLWYVLDGSADSSLQAVKLTERLDTD